MSWIDDALESKYGFVMYIAGILAIGVVALGIVCIVDYYTPKRQSTGVVVMQTQTARRDGTPEYYLYIRDDSTGVTMEKTVSGGMYAYCPKGRKLRYEIHNESVLWDIKLMY